MTKTNRHVIDGVTYEEVERHAEPGDKIVIVSANYTEKHNGYSNGDYFDVKQLFCASVDVTVRNKAGDDDLRFWHDEYRVLVPVTSPKRHEIDGVLYEEVERKAEVGEYVTWVYEGERDDIILKVTELESDGVRVDGYEDVDGSFVDGFEDGAYRVLVPVPSAAPESDADIIANLTRRVFALENARTADGALLIEAFTEMLRKRDERIDALEARLDDAKVTI